MILQIKTGNHRGRDGTNVGGTDAEIQFFIVGANRRGDGWHTLNGDFERGDFESFEHNSPISLRDIRQFYFRLKGRPGIDDWHLQFINITDLSEIWRLEPDSGLIIRVANRYAGYRITETEAVPDDTGPIIIGDAIDIVFPGTLRPICDISKELITPTKTGSVTLGPSDDSANCH